MSFENIYKYIFSKLISLVYSILHLWLGGSCSGAKEFILGKISIILRSQNYALFLFDILPIAVYNVVYQKKKQ